MPHAFTGTWTGAWMRLPDSRPGEPLAAPTAWAPPLSECETPEEASWWGVRRAVRGLLLAVRAPETLAQVLSEALLRPPPTVTLLPHAFTGAWTGACTLFPESTPGEPLAPPPRARRRPSHRVPGLVDARVAGRAVESAHGGDGVAARVHRHVDRRLHVVPGQHTGRILGTAPANESARAGVPYRDRMPVAAAAAVNTPLLRVCRNVVVFLLEDWEAGPGMERGGRGRASRPRLPCGLSPSPTLLRGIGCAGSPGRPRDRHPGPGFRTPRPCGRTRGTPVRTARARTSRTPTRPGPCRTTPAWAGRRPPRRTASGRAGSAASRRGR